MDRSSIGPLPPRLSPWGPGQALVPMGDGAGEGPAASPGVPTAGLIWPGGRAPRRNLIPQRRAGTQAAVSMGVPGMALHPSLPRGASSAQTPPWCWVTWLGVPCSRRSRLIEHCWVCLLARVHSSQPVPPGTTQTMQTPSPCQEALGPAVPALCLPSQATSPQQGAPPPGLAWPGTSPTLEQARRSDLPQALAGTHCQAPASPRPTVLQSPAVTRGPPSAALCLPRQVTFPRQAALLPLSPALCPSFSPAPSEALMPLPRSPSQAGLWLPELQPPCHLRKGFMPFRSSRDLSPLL